MKTLNRLTFFFVSICTIVLFVSCMGKDNEKTGKDDETVTATVSETSEASEQEAIQPPKHPDGLEFVDVVPGEWDWPTNKFLLIGGQDYESDALSEGYFRFKDDFTIAMEDYMGQFTSRWSYSPDDYIFEYEGKMTHRYRVISYTKNELVLLPIYEPRFQKLYTEEELKTPDHWKRLMN